MRIIFTGDNHLEFVSKETINKFFQSAGDASPDITISLGDTTNGWLQTKYVGIDRFFGSPLVLYVMGNHDLWSPHRRSGRSLDKSLLGAVERLSSFPARPLEKSIDDEDTVCIFPEYNCVVVGTMGLPDFSHPKFVMPKEYYEKRSCTNDSEFIDLNGGWLRHTTVILSSFRKRIEKAVVTGCRDIVVATHYPIFEGQYNLSGEDISAYFFCHEAGEMIRAFAKEYPDKRFWCVAAHAHDYCRGEMSIEADNIVSYGLQADYGRLTFAVIDTELGFETEPEVQWAMEAPRWATSYRGPIIFSRESEGSDQS